MNRNVKLAGNEYAMREVCEEERKLTEDSFSDFGWECVRQESLGSGKTALYFRREREENKKLNGLQKECEKLIRDVERARKKPAAALSLVTLVSGIAAAYMLIAGIVAALLGAYAAAGGFAAAGLILLLLTTILTVSAPRVGVKAEAQICSLTKEVDMLRQKAKDIRK